MSRGSTSFRADRLVARRKECGLKSKELAVMCEMTPMSFSRIELGRRGVTADTLAKLAKILGCSTDWLLGLKDSPN